MKQQQPKAVPIKTFGTGREPQGTVYGNMPISKKRIEETTQEAKNEVEAHEKEVSAPILSFQGRGDPIGTSSGGIGLSDQEFLRRTLQWEMQQKALVADRKSIYEVLPNARGTAPTKTFHN